MVVFDHDDVLFSGGSWRAATAGYLDHKTRKRSIADIKVVISLEARHPPIRLLVAPAGMMVCADLILRCAHRYPTEWSQREAVRACDGRGVGQEGPSCRISNQLHVKRMGAKDRTSDGTSTVRRTLWSLGVRMSARSLFRSEYHTAREYQVVCVVCSAALARPEEYPGGVRCVFCSSRRLGATL